MGILSSCSTANGAINNLTSVGSTGPNSIDKENIPFDVDRDIDVQVTPHIRFKFENSSDALLISPAEPFEIEKKYAVIVSKGELDYVHRIIIRQPCLVYIGDVTNKPEIWQYCKQEKIPLTQTGGKVVDYAVSRSGNWLVYAVRNEKGGTDIWKIDREGRNREEVYGCGEFICDNLAIDYFGIKMAFVKKVPESELILFEMSEKQEILIERGVISNVDFSPNGQLLRYFENNKNNLRVLDLAGLKLIQTRRSDSDLVGSWGNDRSSFLFGMRNYRGGIADISIFETNVDSESLTILFNGQELSINYFQPTYFENENLVVLVRNGFSGNSKQIWVVNKEGGKVLELTNDYQYDHSALSWNSVEEKLAFQRYLLTRSDSQPEVWVWEKQDNHFQLIAENAARAIWLH
jgi:Tol biopolymer transport system component